jgi:sugar phosphate isomerase/epimerase
MAGGIKTLVIFGNGARHNRFTRELPLADQLERATEHLRPVAALAGERQLQLALLPHLDYRGHEMVSVMHSINHSALKMAFDTTNPFPVCEEPVDAAQSVLPYSLAVAFKDVQIYPHRSNDVTIWGTPIGQGSVDFDAIIPLLNQELPDPENTTVCIKLRLPPNTLDHAAWMAQSLDYLRNHAALVGQL